MPIFIWSISPKNFKKPSHNYNINSLWINILWKLDSLKLIVKSNLQMVKPKKKTPIEDNSLNINFYTQMVSKIFYKKMVSSPQKILSKILSTLQKTQFFHQNHKHNNNHKLSLEFTLQYFIQLYKN